jgi:hypothetical protein
VSLLLLIFAALHLALLLATFRGPQHGGPRLWLLRAMLFGMFYDNLIQGSGIWFFESQGYYAANALRFVLHAGVLPFLLLFTLSILKQAGIGVARSAYTGFVFAVLTLAGLVYGLYHEVYLLELGPKPAFGVMKLGSLSGLPPLATIATNLLILPLAAWVWYASGWKWFFLGSLFIFVLNGATGAQQWGFIAGNFGELVFILSLLFTDRRFRNL